MARDPLSTGKISENNIICTFSRLSGTSGRQVFYMSRESESLIQQQLNWDSPEFKVNAHFELWLTLWCFVDISKVASPVLEKNMNNELLLSSVISTFHRQKNHNFFSFFEYCNKYLFCNEKFFFSRLMPCSSTSPKMFCATLNPLRLSNYQLYLVPFQKRLCHSNSSRIAKFKYVVSLNFNLYIMTLNDFGWNEVHKM